MTDPDFHLVILGGGCAGLSLARRLAVRDGPSPRVAVIEPRPTYQADRTWSFWLGNGVDHHVDRLIAARWPEWRLASAGRLVVHRTRARPYAMVPSDRFYADAEQAIQESDNVEIFRWTRATSVVEGPGSVSVETDRGRLRSTYVVDCRPPTAGRLATSILFQAFVGTEIEVDRPVFDSGAVELMTDMRVDDDGFVFSYVLPFAPNRALIEVTRFIAAASLPDRLEADLQAATADRVDGREFRVVRRERGVLPMGLDPQRPASSRVVPGGTAAGAGRAATGYAFLRIQRWANDCAVAVRRRLPPVAHSPEPVLRGRMDRLFLRVLRERPDLAPRLFLGLAAGVSADRFARFLSEEAGPLDLLAVVASLPPLPLLRTLLTPSRDGRHFSRRRSA